jgi:hypothetical protein
MAVVRDCGFHPPDDLRLFPMPEPGVLRLDDRAFMAVVRYGDIVDWHYTVADHWFADHLVKGQRDHRPRRRLRRDHAQGEALPFTFNCDIATPNGAPGRRGLGRRAVP